MPHLGFLLALAVSFLASRLDSMASPTPLIIQEGAARVWFSDSKTILILTDAGVITGWDVNSGARTMELKSGDSRLAFAGCPAPGNKVITVAGAKIAVYSLPDAAPVSTVDIGIDITSAHACPTGKSVFVQCADGSLRLIEIATGIERGRFSASFASKKPRVNDVSFSAKGDLVAVAFGAGARDEDDVPKTESVHVWNTRSFKHVCELKDIYQFNLTVAFCPTNENALLFGGSEQRVYLVNCLDPQRPSTLVRLPRPLTYARWLPNGDYIVMAHLGGPTAVFRAEDGKQLWSTKIQVCPQGIAVAPDGALIAILNGDNVYVAFSRTGAFLKPSNTPR